MIPANYCYLSSINRRKTAILCRRVVVAVRDMAQLYAPSEHYLAGRTLIINNFPLRDLSLKQAS